MKGNISNGTHDIKNWVAIQDQYENAVVQIVAQIVAFNWREPYASGEQGEQRGTGFFIDKLGHVVTSAHVIDQAKKVWIHIPALGQRIIRVEVLSICQDRDLALLKLVEEDRYFLETFFGAIPFLPLGDSDKVYATDKVMILGYPLGQYGLKSATGIVSGREFGGMCSLIQITAPLNLGNSGGPLINSVGEVIGIAAATVQAAQNIGYVLPSNELRYILDDLFVYKLVRKGSLGIQFHMASDDMARYFGNPVPAGLYISGVLKGSVAYEVGLQEGDMIYALNGNPLDAYGYVAVPWSSDHVLLGDVLTKFKRGEALVFDVYRAGKKLELKGTFTTHAVLPIRTMYPEVEKIDYEMLGGMVIMSLNDNILDELIEEVHDLVRFDKITAKEEPVLIVTHVVPSSIAYNQRVIGAGSIISLVNGKPVTTLEQLRAAVMADKRDYWTVKTDDNLFVVLPRKQVLEDEARLSHDFVYPMTSMVQQLRAQSNMTAP